MKIAIFIVFIAITLALLWCLNSSRKINTLTSQAIDDLLIAAIVTVIADSAVLLFNSEQISYIAYSVYLVCTDLLLYYMIRFVYRYMNEERPKYLSDFVLLPLMFFDGILMFSNYFHHKIFEVVKITIFEDYTFYRFEVKPLYVIHALVVYSMVAICLVALIKKTVSSVGVYRFKYHCVLVIFFFCVVLNTISLYVGWGVDVTVVLYVIVGILFHYFALTYMPRKLRQSTVNLVIDGMDYGFLVFDVDMNCEYANDLGQKIFAVKEGDVIKPDSHLCKVVDIDIEEQKKGVDCERDIHKIYIDDNGKERRLHIQYKMLNNKLNFRIGSYIFLRDTTEEYEKALQEQYRATHDSLTGLYNKEYFYAKCEEYLAENPDEEYLMVSSDVFNFKLVNDLFGHEKGDELLCRIADEIRQLCHNYDVYGRISSDKFAIMLPKSKYREETFIVAPKKVAYVDSDIYYPLAIYVGVYEITDRSLPVSVMYDRATMALDTIKGDYRKRVVNYDESMRIQTMTEQNMISRFDIALKRGDVKIFLQPQVNDEGEVVGAEALARWIDPIDGIIPPFEFIPLLEKNGMIGKLDIYIWKLACKKLAEWKDKGIDKTISVNISPKDFYYMDIYKVFNNFMKIYDIEPEKLHLEITETAVMSNVKQQVVLIEKLKEAGFVVEMDDFGSGYSSLNMLKDIPIDVVKIDMAFLQKSDNVKKSKKILSAIISLCKDLDFETIVEGVENNEQLEFLLSEGCELFQGYFYSKPIPVEEFEEKYIEGFNELSQGYVPKEFNEELPKEDLAEVDPFAGTELDEIGTEVPRFNGSSLNNNGNNPKKLEGNIVTFLDTE